MPQLELMTSLRAALETNRGTAVNPTRILEMATAFEHSPNVRAIRPKERRASLFRVYRASAGREKHGVRMAGQLSFNQLAWHANLQVKAVTTGTGAGADKTYTFLPIGTDDKKSATLEWGYDATLSATQPGFRLPYVVGDELTVEYDKEADDGATFDHRLHSPKGISQITSFGGSPTALTTEGISPVQIQVYIDAAGGTIGTTEDDYITKATLHYVNTWSDLDTLNQTTAAQDTFNTDRDWDLTMIRYPVNDNELDRYYDKAVRKIRIKATGPTLGASTYTATHDFYGVLDDEGHKITFANGIAMETLKYVPVYNTAAATDHSIVVVTAETTIT